MLGTHLDSPERSGLGYAGWRPSVALCCFPDLPIDRFELLYQRSFHSMAVQVRADILALSPTTEVNLCALDFVDPWDFDEVYSALYQFANTYSFHPDIEDYLVHISTGTHVAQISLNHLAETRHIPARLLQTSPPGSVDSRKPGLWRIIDLDVRRHARLVAIRDTEMAQASRVLKDGIHTLNPGFNRLIEEISTVALHSSAPLLLTGPTGAGKTQLARRIHALKKSRHAIIGELVDINCATLRGDAAMSALFGHVKGAFTGAFAPRAGLLMKADKGVLFLDEIGELGLDEQAMLLHALETKSFFPVGSDRTVSSNFQLIAGTNKDLQLAVNDGKFREDLFARINLWTFRLPGLSERREDISPNLDYELKRFELENGTAIVFSARARHLYLDFALSDGATWFANFRDLNGSVMRMGTLCENGVIQVVDVEREIERLKAKWQTLPNRQSGQGMYAPLPAKTRIPRHESIDASNSADSFLLNYLDRNELTSIDPFDRLQLASVVRVCVDSKNLSEAGRKLFSSSRRAKSSTNDADRLRKYLARFGLTFADLNPLAAKTPSATVPEADEDATS